MIALLLALSLTAEHADYAETQLTAEHADYAETHAAAEHADCAETQATAEHADHAETRLTAEHADYAEPQPAATPDAATAFAEANAHFEKNENDLALAAYERAIALDPTKAQYHVGKGRTLARLRRYDAAFAAYGAALKIEPDNPMILRYRGHNYINVRRLDDALADLTRAESMKKDDYGIYYHLALAHYLQGSYAKAAEAYEGCLRTATTDENRVACMTWQYLALRRAGRDADAAKVLDAATPDLKVTESAAYLDRLLLFKGVKTEDEVTKRMAEGALQASTVGYGVGIWHLLHGRPDRAKEYFSKATSTDYWPAFGFIASEIELKRMK